MKYIESKQELLASIIINNYNYDRFLAAAIDSALNQTYPFVEVIVVDDGSTDSSRDIIATYGNKIIPILKNNGGQASALNEGFKASQGKIVLFLDSDDLFSPDKVEQIVTLFDRDRLCDLPIALHNMFESIDENSCLTQSYKVEKLLSLHDREWDLLSKLTKIKFSFFAGKLHRVTNSDVVYEFASKYRYIPYIGMPTSSISISRTMGEHIFPLPIARQRILSDHADTFLTKAASVVGLVYSTDLVLTQYRLHQNSWHIKKIAKEKADLLIKLQDDFLNSKLQEMEKEPIFCYLDSMAAKNYYRLYLGYESSKQLFQLSIKVIKWYANWATILFFIKTVGLSGYFKYKSFASNKYRLN